LDAIWSGEVWPESDRRPFRGEWAILEQIYAGALDDSRVLDPEEVTDVRAALGLLAALLPPPTDASAIEDGTR
jgi:hypothetical protein